MNFLSARELLESIDVAAGRLPPGADDRTVIGVRPEHVLISGGGTDELAVGMARIDRIEDLGHEALVHLTTAHGVSLTARASGEIRSEIDIGNDTPLAIRADRLHAFDTETGERLV